MGFIWGLGDGVAKSRGTPYIYIYINFETIYGVDSYYFIVLAGKVYKIFISFS